MCGNRPTSTQPRAQASTRPDEAGKPKLTGGRGTNCGHNPAGGGSAKHQIASRCHELIACRTPAVRHRSGVRMHHEVHSATSQVLARLLALYGSALTIPDLAIELRTTPNALHSRRSRGSTGGLPDPIPGVTPYLYRAVDIARWLAGETAQPTAKLDATALYRRPGRPRKVAGSEN